LAERCGDRHEGALARPARSDAAPVTGAFRARRARPRRAAAADVLCAVEAAPLEDLLGGDDPQLLRDQRDRHGQQGVEPEEPRRGAIAGQPDGPGEEREQDGADLRGADRDPVAVVGVEPPPQPRAPGPGEERDQRGEERHGERDGGHRGRSSHEPRVVAPRTPARTGCDEPVPDIV
jgi:hypothetical protein